jgi:hypothetical protein
MMKQIFSILLSFILLASHSYLTFGTHFCGGEAVESRILFGETHLGCGMMDMEESCNDPEESNKSQTSFDNIPCCENDYQTIQVSDEYVKEATPITINVDFALAFVYATLNLDLLPNSTQKSFTEYFAPLLKIDLQALLQTFLI